MKCRHKGLICCIIAIFILFSGMCVEQPQAGSLFACRENIASTSYVSSPKGTLSRYGLCIPELMGTQGTSFIAGNVELPVMRTFYRISLLLSLVAIFLLGLSKLQAAVEMVRSLKTHYCATILNYIHSQDGKK